MATERRNQPRTNLRVPLYLLPKGATVPIQTETEDLSLEGFYCYAEQYFTPGEDCQFLMLLPPATKGSLALGSICLQGCVQIVRLTVTGDLKYGLGCHVKSYRVLSNPEILTPEGITAALLENEDQQLRSTSLFRNSAFVPRWPNATWPRCLRRYDRSSNQEPGRILACWGAVFIYPRTGSIR
jgi:hypothetical protein